MSDTCAICLDNKLLTAKSLPCAHMYCKKCGIDMLQRCIKNCPMCRSNIDTFNFNCKTETTTTTTTPITTIAVDSNRRYFRQPPSDSEDDDDDAGYGRNDMYPDDYFTDEDDAPLVYDY